MSWRRWTITVGITLNNGGMRWSLITLSLTPPSGTPAQMSAELDFWKVRLRKAEECPQQEHLYCQCHRQVYMNERNFYWLRSDNHVWLNNSRWTEPSTKWWIYHVYQRKNLLCKATLFHSRKGNHTGSVCKIADEIRRNKRRYIPSMSACVCRIAIVSITHISM